MELHSGKCDFPLQVSIDQASQDRSEIRFSSGASFRTGDTLSGLGQRNYRNLSIQAGSTRTPHVGTSAHSHRPRYADYVDYSQRLRSFARWIHTTPGPQCLAEAGFFFTNQYDLVRCFQCGIGLKDFSADDDPLLEHVRHSSDCPFLLERLGVSGLSAYRTRCREQERVRNEEQSSQCQHPEYMTLESRIGSFARCPEHMTKTPRELAEAGLYYTGVEDLVRCFMCDGGLKKWDPEAVPWTEHCRWFPGCPYAREKKGEDFIALVQASAMNANEPQDGENLTSNQSFGNDNVSGSMEQLTLRDPQLRTALNEHIETCLEVGFQQKHINKVLQQLRNMGIITPTIEDILDMVGVVQEREQRASQEAALEENIRLKQLITCMKCGKNTKDALFLPCAHHHLCMECAEPLKKCPACQRNIRQKIKTFLARFSDSTSVSVLNPLLIRKQLLT